jgi:hypothetical protein
VIRKKLSETLTLAERLRLLLDLSERLGRTATPADTLTPDVVRKGAQDVA